MHAAILVGKGFHRPALKSEIAETFIKQTHFFLIWIELNNYTMACSLKLGCFSGLAV